MLHFEPLDLDHYERLRPFFGRQPCWLSLYSLPSMLAWRDADGFQIRFAIDQDAVIFAAENRSDPDQNHIVLPVPTLTCPPERLQRLCLETGHRAVWFVPESYLAEQDPGKVQALFAVTPQPEYDDYLFHTSDLADLRGKRYAKKRNLITQFERGYADQNRVRVEAISDTIIAECQAFLEEWCEERDCDEAAPHQLACEKKALQNALSSFVRLEFEGITVRVDGKICGLGASSRLCEEVGVLHFEKAFTRHKGLYQYLDRECARRLFAGRFPYINKESDMNLPGLRQAKSSYFPIQKIRSFQLTLRD